MINRKADPKKTRTPPPDSNSSEVRWFLVAATKGSEADNSLLMLLSRQLRPTGTLTIQTLLTPVYSPTEALSYFAIALNCAARLQAKLQLGTRTFLESLNNDSDKIFGE